MHKFAVYFYFPDDLLHLERLLDYKLTRVMKEFCDAYSSSVDFYKKNFFYIFGSPT